MECGSFIISGGKKSDRQALLVSLLRHSRSLGQTLTDFASGKVSPLEHPEEGIELKADVDTMIITVEEEEDTIKIEAIRQLQGWLSTKPVIKSEKVGIILEAQNLTEEAQNAFLKTLEEPPKDVFIILSVADSELLLPTVASRCQEISLKNTSYQELSEEERSQIKKVAELLLENDLGNKWQQAATLAKTKEGALLFLDGLTQVLHSELVASPNSNAQLLKRLQAVAKSSTLLRQNANARLVIENLFLFW